MTLQQSFRRWLLDDCIETLSYNRRQQVRFASWSPRLFQSQQQKQPPTNFLEKYQDKLEQKAREEGFSSISELREQYQPKITSVKKERVAAPSKFGHLESPSLVSSIAKSSEAHPAISSIKTLASYVDVDKLRKHTNAKEIEFIWRMGHSKESLICAVIPSPIYNRMISLARSNPMFILPLRRGSGLEMHLMEFKFPESNVTHILFTSLLEYKTHGEFARPHTTVMHFEDLAMEKGVVLMRGEVEGDKHGVGLDDAGTLVMAVQKMYGADSDTERGRKRRSLLEKFTKGSDEFNVDRLMDELNRVD